MNLLIQLKQTTSVFLVALWLACFGLAPKIQAVTPPPDGGYPNGNTAEGQNALLSLTTGGYNTAVGFLSLAVNTTNNFNTAVGAGTLLANFADENTAIGAGALLSNTSGDLNTAVGGFALFSNIGGATNTADGAGALEGNTTGNGNTATGAVALSSNDTGGINTAIGENALVNNTTGSGNTAIGADAGSNQTTGSDNVYIGAGILGVSGETGACYIAGIFGQTSSGGAAVFINSDGKLGTTTSSKRFKENIKPMDKASEGLFLLKPVSFRYKKEIDPTRTAQLGLVAEDVETVNPDLVVRDKEGKPYSIRYDQVNAMLLNGFLKEHDQVQDLKSTVAKQQKGFEAKLAKQEEQIEKLTAGLEKVSALLEVKKSAPRTVSNDH